MNMAPKWTGEAKKIRKRILKKINRKARSNLNASWVGCEDKEIADYAAALGITVGEAKRRIEIQHFLNRRTP